MRTAEELNDQDEKLREVVFEFPELTTLAMALYARAVMCWVKGETNESPAMVLRGGAQRGLAARATTPQEGQH